MMNEKELKEKLNEYLIINEKSLEIAKTLTNDNSIDDILFIENYLYNVAYTCDRLYQIMSTSKIMRSEEDKIYLKTFTDDKKNQFKIQKELFEKGCIDILESCSNKIQWLKDNKQEYILEYGEEQYNFNINFFKLMKKLDPNKYDDLYNYSIYNMYLLIMLKYADETDGE